MRHDHAHSSVHTCGAQGRHAPRAHMPANLKRKRAQGGEEKPAAPTSTSTAAAPAPPRRATRQSSIPPLPVPQDPEPRRRRRRPDDPNGPPTETAQPSRSPRGKENIPVNPEQQQQPQQQRQHPRSQQQQLKQPTRLTRHSASHEAPPAPRPSNTNVHHSKPAVLLANDQNSPMAVPDTQRQPPRPRAVPSAATAPGRQGTRLSTIDPFIPHQQSVSVGRSKPIIMTTSVAQPGQTAASRPSGAPDGAGRTADGTGQPDRNIDKVVLGDICFRAWYPSYYGKEVLGDNSGNSAKGGKDLKSNGNGTSAAHHSHEGRDDSNGGKTHGRRDRDHHPPMLDRLYVCPCCFKYSKELVTWWEHVRWCERRGVVPGKKIYTHPKGKRTIRLPPGPATKQGRGKRGSVGQKVLEEVVQDEGEWSIWEVDGETDVVSPSRFYLSSIYSRVSNPPRSSFSARTSPSLPSSSSTTNPSFST